MGAENYDLKPLAAFVNGTGDRYPRACRLFIDLMAVLKLNVDDKQDLLIDISDILDGLPPSARSGIKAR